MTNETEPQVILLKDLYSVLENLDAHLQDIVNKNKISVREFKIVSEGNLLRLLLYTTDDRVIAQLFKKEFISSAPPCKLSCPPFV